MTRLDTPASETVGRTDCDGPRALLLDAREVPLGGVRAMSVYRSLPQRDLPMVGAWCFFDRFGPQETRMRVEPHPHIGLQTVTWPLVGDVRHRDSIGSDVVLRRGQLNLMTSGGGIAHSEYSVGDDPIPLDALQLWVALPESRRHGGPDFEQHENLPEVVLPDAAGAASRAATATVVLGRFAGVDSPASVHTPIVGAEIHVPAGARIRVPLEHGWEHAIACVSGTLSVVTDDSVATHPVTPQQLLYLGLHRDAVEITAETDATVFLLGGAPFEDDIVMWWNFVGRSHDEIVAAREAWEAGDPRFGPVLGHAPGFSARIPAPPMPQVRLTRRRRRV